MSAIAPILWRAIEPNTADDQDRLRLGLRHLSAEDPALYVTVDDETNLVTVAGIGETHLQIVIDRLACEFHVDAVIGDPQVAYKEAITQVADGEGRYVRRTGGRGQHGHVKIRVTPRKSGEGYRFENGIVGGAIPASFITPIEQGIREAMSIGALAGYPMDDIAVELCDGSFDENDSTDMAFTIAGAMAFMDAAKKARPVVVEPIMRVEATVPEARVNDVIGDITTKRRGLLQSMATREGMQVIGAHVPLSTMLGYAADLRSLTDGRGSYVMYFDRYAEAPEQSDSDDDGSTSPVSSPRKPAPTARPSSASLREPDDGRSNG